MVRYLPYDPSSTIRVEEQISVVDNKAFLRHIPKKGSVMIDGFTEVDGAPVGKQFFCDYATDTLYRDANRVLLFGSVDDYELLSVSYIAIGTVITADDMNEIKAHLENEAIHDYQLLTMAPDVKGGAKLGANLYMTGDTLNASVGGSNFQIGDGFYRSEQEAAGMFLRDCADEPVLNSRALFQALKRFPMYSYDIEEGVNQGYFAVETLEDNFVRFTKRASRHGDLMSFYQEPNSGGFADEGWAFRTNDKWIILSYYKTRYDMVADAERWDSINPFLTVKDRLKLDDKFQPAFYFAEYSDSDVESGDFSPTLIFSQKCLADKPANAVILAYRTGIDERQTAIDNDEEVNEEDYKGNYQLLVRDKENPRAQVIQDLGSEWADICPILTVADRKLLDYLHEQFDSQIPT